MVISEAQRRRLPLGAVTELGRIAMVARINGEPFYWILTNNGIIAIAISEFDNARRAQ